MTERLGEELTLAKGVKDGLPIAFGYVSVAFAFGMLAIEKGLPLWAPIVISLTNFTGTGQFVGMGMIFTTATLLEVAFTMLIVNLRYLLMSLSLSQRIEPGMPLWKRIIIAFGNTDEIFAVSMQQNRALNFRYMLGLILCAYSGWILGTCIGAMASSLLPLSVRSALGIAIYAMFIAIIIPPAREMRPVAIVVALAVGLSCLFKWIPFLNAMGSGWAIIICGVAASAAGALLFPIKVKKEGDKHGL